ncbi:tributyrin esterase [Stieleria sp. ICT_E10.1]|uniref:tributyrin esterase n=1 Tax=Stieleria sedimenti TaxID=2976331 RepID=UPI00217FDC22|nr:tributyrin esterase [Stieleria sedimenti]MCS7471149.1 tributyrin esterase [Stieleria sedimenti]
MPHVPKPPQSAKPPTPLRSAPAESVSRETLTNKTLPADALPADALPSDALPSDALPIDALPDEARQLDSTHDTMVGFDQESVDSTSLPDIDHEFSMQELFDAELREAIRSVPLQGDEEKFPRVEILGADGQHAALMRIDHPVKLRVRGSLGDYAFAYNSQTVIKVFGNVGHGVAEGMSSGSIRVRGHAGHGAGTAMTGGTLGIYGSAGDRTGGAMRGGGLFVRGDVGNDVGLGALAGTIVIGGDAGNNLGNPLSNVAVFIRGKAASLTPGVTEAPLRKKQEVQLGLLLISAGIRGDATDFRRIVPIAKLAAENAARGEVVPNWR